MDTPLFLSHSSKDKPEIQALRRELELRGVACFEDVRELRADDRLLDLQKRVAESRSLLVLVTANSLGSRWVRRECRWGQETRDLRAASGAAGGAADPAGAYRLIALTRGVTPDAAALLVGDGDRLVIPVDGLILDAVPAILQALSTAPPPGRLPVMPPAPPPRSELVVELRAPRWAQVDGRRRPHADVVVHHRPPAGEGGRKAIGTVESPLGPIELGRLQWYLETFPRWAFAENLVRGRGIEAELQGWGYRLFEATVQPAGILAGGFLVAEGERRIVIEVEAGGDGPDRAGAAAAWLALPWELLADSSGYLFPGARGIRVVRRLPREQTVPPLPLAPRLKVLLVVARTDDAGFIDARASLTPLVEALRPLGHKVALHVLPDGTLAALTQELQAAADAGKPYQVVHFDGHGVYDPLRGLGMLVFEKPAAQGVLERDSDRVDADKLGAVLRAHRVPLFVLEACQTGQTDAKVESSVAGTLLKAGVGSVVAMSHSVLVETARRFVTPFYTALAQGHRPSTAMIWAQQALFTDTHRNRPGQPAWTLQDWFVPLLFQDGSSDVPLLPPGPLPQAEDLQAEWAARLAATPALPRHGFVGRARELLALYRLLHGHRAVALLGVGGQGKTALAIEAARWLLAIGRQERLAWVSVEHHGEARVVVDALGRQLVAGWKGVAMEEGDGGDLEPAIARLERALRDWRVLVVIDNLESVLDEPEPALLALLGRLAGAGESRLLLTSREAPPDAIGAAVLRIGPLSREEGRALVAGVLQKAALAVSPGPEGDDPVGRLVDLVRGHPRSLVLLAPRLGELGVQGTVAQLGPILAELDRQHPGDRENSLLASVRLSLDRLPDRQREQVRALSVFVGAADSWVLSQVMGTEVEEALALCRALVALGLADAEGSFLLFEPSLPAAVVGEVEEAELAVLRWREATAALAQFLYQQREQDAQLSATGTRLALGELLAVVDELEAAVSAGQVGREYGHSVVRRVEALVEMLGRPRVLAQVVSARRRLGAGLQGWSSARFNQERAEVEQRLGAGDLRGALEGAQALLRRGEAEGDAYPDADYDRAMAHILLGRVLLWGGLAAQAVPVLEEARRRFEAVESRAPGRGAARMAAVCITERADALRGSGRLEDAAAGYEEAQAASEAMGDARTVAVARCQLGTVRMLQGRYDDALTAYRAARETMQELGDQASLAVAWHQEAMVHREAGNPAAAERAYLTSLDIKTRLGNQAGQAATLIELGNLFRVTDHLEEATEVYRRAADSYAALGQDRPQSFALGNLARTLLDLGRHDDARTAITDAIRLQSPYGPTAEPWKAQAILSDIEAAAGNPTAAATARTEAIRLYRAYRDDGGSPHDATGRLAEQLHRAIQSGADPASLADQLPPIDEQPERARRFLGALAALLRAQPTNRDDPAIYYRDRVELHRLRDLLATCR